MRVAFLLISLSVVLFTGCKSKDSCHRCPYESGIKNIQLDYDKHIFLNPEPSLSDINSILPSEPLNFSELFGFSTNPLLSLYKSIINKAFDYEGVRYKTGGTSTKGMDCSGLVYTCYSACGISLPRTSADMSNSVHDISPEKAQAGDLIFFKTNRRHGRINHVGLIVEANNDEIKFIHASIQKGVIVSSTQEDYYARAFAKVGRVLHSNSSLLSLF